MTLEYDRFEQVAPAQGSNDGGRFQRDDGSQWYLKYPENRRQGQNEVLASAFYREMGFDAVEYHHVDNGMVASRWRAGLPKASRAEDLRGNDTVQEAFLPSALLANWDVIGLVYDNCLYDPEMMDGPVFLDFGGSFDTRAQGAHKDYSATDIPALDGYTDPAINQSAARVFEGMTPDLFEASKDRLRTLTENRIMQLVLEYPTANNQGFANTIIARRTVLLNTDYADVF